MIALAGMLRLAAGEAAPAAIEARARWDLETLQPPASGTAQPGPAPAN